MNILLTGSSGFLGQNIKQFFKDEYPDYNIIEFSDRLNINQEVLIEKYRTSVIDIIIHMASPTCSEDFKKLNNYQIARTIISGTNKFINLAIRHNAELIFFSSEAIYERKDIYGISKFIAGSSIQRKMKDYKILIIPRVYSSLREKGLIRKLKDNKVLENEMQHMIEYLDIKDFMKQFKNIFSAKDQKIFRFYNKVQGSIKDIKQRYLGNS